MFKKIINWLTRPSKSKLELFILSKHPTNAAEVDFWTRHYESQYRGF